MGIVAEACGVWPVAPVGRGVVVQEYAFIPLCANAPIGMKMLGEEEGNVLPDPVRVVAGVDEPVEARGETRDN